MRALPFAFGRWFVSLSLLCGGEPASGERIPFDSATVTRVENQVTVGEIKGGRAGARRATSVADVIRTNNFVQTGGNSRAELQFRDNSLVRVGQNSIFSFEASSRSLSLDKGDMLFYVAPGNGGGTIKTPALTAGITGTLCKVSTNMIAVLRGSITSRIDGRAVRIRAGYAIMVVNGKARIFRFDPRAAAGGRLYAMGPLPEDPGIQITRGESELDFPRSHERNAIDSGQVNPGIPRASVPVKPQVLQTQQPGTLPPTPPNGNPNGNPNGP